MTDYENKHNIDISTDYEGDFYYPGEREYLESLKGKIDKIDEMNSELEKMIKNREIIILDSEPPF